MDLGNLYAIENPKVCKKKTKLGRGIEEELCHLDENIEGGLVG